MEIPRHWRLKAQRYRLEGSACPICGQVSFPPRPVCPHCTAKPMRIAARGFVPVVQEQFTAKQVCLNIMQNEKFGASALK